MRNTKAKPVTVNGIDYPSVNKACEVHKLSSHKVGWRLNNNWTIDEAFELVEREKEIYECNGKEYKSVRSLYYDNEEYLQKINNNNIYYKKVCNRMAKGWTYREALGLEKRKRNVRHDPITVEGVTYENDTEAAIAYNLEPKLVQSRLSRGWSIARTFNLEDVQDRVNLSDEERTIDGITYKSIAAAARAYNKKYSTVLWRVKFGRQTLKEALELVPVKKKRKGRHFYNNKYYTSYEEIYHDHDHIQDRPSLNTYMRRISDKWTIDEALGITIHISKNLKNCPFELRGKRYKNAHKAILYLGLKSKSSQIYKDLRTGDSSIQEVFEYHLSRKEKRDVRNK